MGEINRILPKNIIPICKTAYTILLSILLLTENVIASKSTYTYMPRGNNALLYTPGLEPILHFDQDTFADTVFDPSNTNAFFIEYYADW